MNNKNNSSNINFKETISKGNDYLNLPLPQKIINYIKSTEKENDDIIISTIELTLKNSEDKYNDLLKALEPILKIRTSTFLNKIFMYNKRYCISGNVCINKNCLFKHPEFYWKNEFNSETSSRDINSETNTIKDSEKEKGDLKKEEFVTTYRNSAFSKIKLNNNSEIDDDPVKRIKRNKEVIFNKVDEERFTISNVQEFCTKFGELESVRRLKIGKFLIVFKDFESSHKLVDYSDFVLGDPLIKKFYNVMNANYNSNFITPVTSSNSSNFNVVDLLVKQEKYIDELMKTNKTDLNDLKIVTLRIKNYILQSKGESININKPKQVETQVDSIYSNLFK